MIYSALDQFKIAPLIKIVFLTFDLSLTNFLLASILTLLILYNYIFYIQTLNTNSFFLIPNSWQNTIEKLYLTLINLLLEIVKTNNIKYFPFLNVIFFFILLNNLFGLIPFSFTVTSYSILTFFLSFSFFIGIVLIGFKKHGLKFFSLFLPSNTNFFLSLLIVPIELMSFLSKPISLGARLFINLLAGHTLLKVIVGFSWNILLPENFLSIIFFIPLIILIVLFGLEFAVALIQAYVFSILTCIYLNDSEKLH